MNSRPTTTLAPVAADRRTRLHGSVVIRDCSGDTPQIAPTLDGKTGPAAGGCALPLRLPPASIPLIVKSLPSAPPCFVSSGHSARGAKPARTDDPATGKS